MADPKQYTIQELIACVDRELKMRLVVYPRWVNAPKPKMTPAAMDSELAKMRAVRQRLLEHEAVLRDVAVHDLAATFPPSP